MGIVSQETLLFEEHSVIDNVSAPALIAGERRPRPSNGPGPRCSESD